jgi:hypothetical protein
MTGSTFCVSVETSDVTSAPWATRVGDTTDSCVRGWIGR